MSKMSVGRDVVIKRYMAIGLVAGMLVCVLPTRAGANPVKARWAADLVDSVGINTHFADSSSGYIQHLETLKQQLLFARVRHLRDAGIADKGEITPNDAREAFQTLGKAGLHINFVVDRNASAEFVKSFPDRVAPALESFELPNEANLASGAIPWQLALRRWTIRFHQLVTDGSARYPIVGPSLVIVGLDNPYAELGDVARYVAVGNLHEYQGARSPETEGWGGAGKPPCQNSRYGSRDFSVCYARAAFPGRPLFVTETGWATGQAAQEHVTESVQAKYIVQSVLSHFAAGIVRTYLYQLMDAGTDGGMSMGLVHSDGSPKPAMISLATMLRRLDGPTQRGDAGAADIDVMVDGTPVSEREISRVLLRHSDGRFVLVLWRGEAPAASKPIEVGIAGLTNTPTGCEIQLETCVPLTLDSKNDGRYTLLITEQPTLIEFRLN